MTGELSTSERQRTADVGDQPTVEQEVLRLVRAFATELGVGGAHLALDDSLARDLGLGSLERVELLARLEQAFGVRLPDAVMAEADSPGDLVRAILGAGPPVTERAPAAPPPLVAGRAAPASAATLIDVLAWHAELTPERVHIVLRTEDGAEQAITHRALLERAGALAAGLRDHGVRASDAVALMLRTEEAFFPAFFAILLAGAVPVPIYPPFRPDRLEEYAERQVGILRNAEARLLVTFGEAERVAALLGRRVPSVREVVAVDRLAGSGAPAARVGHRDAALIQYTSGSTGDPKGVLLTHGNVLANIRALGVALGIGPDDIAVSWLPLYHDMGLIGAWLGALYHGVPVVIMSPLAFLARPARWLAALSAHRGTLSPAPNFAFDLCVKRIHDDEIEGLDLSRWRLALNGSEAVSAETIHRFTGRFGRYGFKAEAMCPVYGLAEASVGLTVSPPGRAPRIEAVAREPFERTRRADPAPADAASPLRFVSCGHALPGHDVRIVDARGRPVAERVEGRIEFRGPSVTSGYFRHPETTRAVRHDGWFDSGDLGYRADGELFITGRQKDVIIKAGRNLYPQEVEEVVGDVPGIRKGCVAAFGIADPEIGTERLVVAAESRETDADPLSRLRSRVVDRVVAALGIPPDVVVIAPPGAVPKTSSGKIRRTAARAAYVRGEMERARPSVRVQWLRLLVHDAAARLRRFRETGAALSYAGFVGLVLLLTGPPLWVAARVLPPRAVDRVVRRWCRGVLALTGCRLHVEGLANLPEGPVVLAANHSSYLDSVALFAALPTDFRFVAKRELVSMPLVGTVIRRVGHPTVERVDLSRSVADAERVAAVLRAGTSLCFFPEGTFFEAPGLLPFKLGAFKAAVEAQAPIVPVTILGTREILPGDTWRPRRGTVTVSIGSPVVPAGQGWREVVRLREVVRAEIAGRLGKRASDAEAPPASGSGPGRATSTASDRAATR